VTAAGLILLTVLLRRRQSKLPISGWEKLGLALGGLVGAAMGAKVPFWLWNAFVGASASTEGVSSWVWLASGKTILGGIVGGYLGIELMKFVLDIRVRTGDTYVVPVAVAIAVGRLACFVGGCCFGAPTDLPWGMRFPLAPDEGTLLRHPTQLYEALFHASAAAAFLLVERRGWFVGQRIKLYLMAYLVYRFVTEWLRPEPEVFLGLTAYQLACPVLLAIFGALYVRDEIRYGKRPTAAAASDVAN
jgi:prolipoprotein diacylglyceryltransferase